MKELEKGFINIVVILFWYYVIVISTGFIRILYISSEIESSAIFTARVSAIVSLAVNGLLACLVLGVIMGLCFFIRDLMKTSITIDSLFDGFKITFCFLAILELIKLALVYVFIDNEMLLMAQEDNFDFLMSRSEWYVNVLYANKVGAILAPVLFTSALIALTDRNYRAIIDCIILGCSFLVGFYLTSIGTLSFI